MKTAPQDTSLFSLEKRARARKTDPITSFWAAQGVDVNRRQGMVLDALVAGEATQHELIDRVREMHGSNIAESTIRTGVSELQRDGLVESLGPIGLSPSGHKANVYRRIPPSRWATPLGTHLTSATTELGGSFAADKPAAPRRQGDSTGPSVLPDDGGAPSQSLSGSRSAEVA